jgi:hypothetical protein
MHRHGVRGLHETCQPCSPDGGAAMKGAVSAEVPNRDITRDEYRALQRLADVPRGIAETLMLAHGFTHELIGSLVLSGLAIVVTDIAKIGGETIRVELVIITETGRRVLEGLTARRARPGTAPAESDANVGLARRKVIEGSMTKPAKQAPATWDVYLARHSPVKWIGTVEAIDAYAAIAEAAKLFRVKQQRKLIAVRRR